ncbi:hypothetical protein [Nonomuraea roseola]|uniref:Uncharacterized protein n=1 Tax=Nonomuraea roseola TaxID=46179 RepID=A0ABV5PSY2_9ACTN
MNRRLLDELNRATTPTARPNPLVVLWRWRYEIGLPVLLSFAIRQLGPVVLLFAAVLLWPPARSEVWGRIRCVVLAHRIRVGCVEAYVVNRRGKIPIVLWCAPAPFGARVWVWCRAGTTPDQLEAGRQVIAAACWVSEVVVLPHPRHGHRVLLEVVCNRYGVIQGREVGI